MNSLLSYIKAAVVLYQARLLRGKGSFILRLIELFITIPLTTKYTVLLSDFFMMFSVFLLSIFVRTVALVQLFFRLNFNIDRSHMLKSNLYSLCPLPEFQLSPCGRR